MPSKKPTSNWVKFTSHSACYNYWISNNGTESKLIKTWFKTLSAPLNSKLGSILFFISNTDVIKNIIAISRGSDRMNIF